MPAYTITPQDVLMFRDGRPMEGSLSGHGARWPEPSIIFDALHAAFHRAFPEAQAWEDRHDWGRSSTRPCKGDDSQRFGSLSTLGPFPVSRGQWFFPCPADVTRRDCNESTLLPLRGQHGTSNLPPQLLYSLGSLREPDKQ